MAIIFNNVYNTIYTCFDVKILKDFLKDIPDDAKLTITFDEDYDRDIIGYFFEASLLEELSDKEFKEKKIIKLKKEIAKEQLRIEEMKNRNKHNNNTIINAEISISNLQKELNLIKNGLS